MALDVGVNNRYKSATKIFQREESMQRIVVATFAAVMAAASLMAFRHFFPQHMLGLPDLFG